MLRTEILFCAQRWGVICGAGRKLGNGRISPIPKPLSKLRRRLMSPRTGSFCSSRSNRASFSPAIPSLLKFIDRLLDEEARGVGPELAVIVEEIDAATRAETQAAGGDGGAPAALDSGLKIDWPSDWHTDSDGDPAEDPDAAATSDPDGGLPGPESANPADSDFSLLEPSMTASTGPANSDSGDDQSLTNGGDELKSRAPVSTSHGVCSISPTFNAFAVTDPSNFPMVITFVGQRSMQS